MKKLELHILQNFAPSNLNRDDTGAPKDCEFGGYRRARISSQCLKRAVRQTFRQHELVPEEQLAVRTKRIVAQIADRLVSKDRPRPESEAFAVFVLGGAKLKVVENGLTQYLLYLPTRNIGLLAELIDETWDELSQACPLVGAEREAAVAAGGEAEVDEVKGRGKSKSKNKEKAKARDAVPKDITARVTSILEDGSQTADLALFGRMIADNPDWNVDAACQVAHAFSTNRVSMDFDFFTAVDDFRPADTAGSGMMGTVQFNSACFYRYSVIDLDQLAKTLGENEIGELTRSTALAYVRAAALAVPTGKQNSMAAQNPPSYVLAVIRSGGMPISLANAFLVPCRPDGDKPRPDGNHDLVGSSIAALEKYFGRITKMYGAKSVGLVVSCADRDFDDAGGAIVRVDGLDSLLEHVAVGFGA